MIILNLIIILRACACARDYNTGIQVVKRLFFNLYLVFWGLVYDTILGKLLKVSSGVFDGFFENANISV